jgi:peptide/nickel transport system substrate-binding protein
MKRRTHVALLALTTLVLATGAGCGGSDSDGASTFRVGLENALDSPNPTAAYSSDALFTAIYPRLVRYADSLDGYTPDLAKSWSASSDKKSFTFKLATGGKWSDGKPVTARDVAFTLNTYVKYADVGGAGQYAGNVAAIAKVEAPDPATAVVHYKQPISEELALSNIALPPILPAHVWSKHTGNGGKDLLKFANLPAVTGGAFNLKRFRKNEFALLERNENFYGRKPRVKTVGIKVFTSPDARVAALKSGEIDLASSLAPSSLPAVTKDDSLAIKSVPSPRFEELIVNSREANTRHPSLQDPQVREAISLALDRANLAKVVYGGQAKAARGILSADIGPWHNPAIKPDFDPDRAKQLLDDAGYRSDGGGVRENPRERLAFKVILDSTNPNASRLFALIKEDLAEIGVQVTAASQDLTALVNTMTKTNDWDMISVAPLYQPDPDNALTDHTCDGFFQVYCDKRYDRLTEQQRFETDDAQRVELVHRAEALLANSYTHVALALLNTVEAYRNDWDGIVVLPDGSLSIFSNETLLGVHKD